MDLKMMIKKQTLKLFGLLFHTIRRKKICLGILICHLGCFLFANIHNPEDVPPRLDSLSSNEVSVIGEITSLGSVIIIEDNKHYKATVADKKNVLKKNPAFKHKTKFPKPTVHKNLSADTSKKIEEHIATTPYSGVIFSNSTSDFRIVVPTGFNNLLLVKTEKVLAKLSSKFEKKIQIEVFSVKTKYNSFRLTFFTRPPPFV